MNRRDYLVTKGLAQHGRGKFSREAHAALATARAEGVLFDDDTPPKALGKRRAIADKRAADPQISIPAPRAGKRPAVINGEVIEGVYTNDAPYPPLPPQPKLRDIGKEGLFGFTKQGYKVNFLSCRLCGLHGDLCACTAGILAPSIVVTLPDDSPARIG